MDIDALISQGWSEHADDPSGVAARVEDAVAAVTDASAPRLVGLSNHVIGQHLKDWARAGKVARGIAGRVAPSAPVLANLAVALYLSGETGEAMATELRAATVAPADALAWLVRVRLLSAEALMGVGRRKEAMSLLGAATDLVDAADLPAVHRMLAITANNATGELLKAADRTPDEGDALLKGAETARKYWLKVGTWTHDERSDYLLASVGNALGRWALAKEAAERGLRTLAANGEEKVDEAFLRLELAKALRGAREPGAREVLAKADAIAAGFDEGLRGWWMEERGKIGEEW